MKNFKCNGLNILFLFFSSSNQINLDAASEDHYQFYYSYFYNRNSNSPKVLIKPARARILPSTTNMSFCKKNINSSQSQLLPKYDLISAEDNSLKTDRNDNIPHNCMNYRQYVLKEKCSNNNNEATFHNGNWQYDHDEQFKCAGDDYFNVKNFETLELNSPNLSKISKDDSLCLPNQQRNKRKLRTSSVDMFEKDNCDNILAEGGITDAEQNVNACNTLDYKKKTQKSKLLIDSEEFYRQNLNFPVSPTKLKGKYISIKGNKIYQIY